MAAVLLFFSLWGFTGFNFSLSIRESVAWTQDVRKFIEFKGDHWWII